MATSSKQDQNFLDEVVSRSLLDDAIGWMRDNLEPIDVFTDGQLRNWALDNGFVIDTDGDE